MEEDLGKERNHRRPEDQKEETSSAAGEEEKRNRLAPSNRHAIPKWGANRSLSLARAEVKEEERKREEPARRKERNRRLFSRPMQSSSAPWVFLFL